MQEANAVNDDVAWRTANAEFKANSLSGAVIGQG
jgi:hypothetical protein